MFLWNSNRNSGILGVGIQAKIRGKLGEVFFIGEILQGMRCEACSVFFNQETIESLMKTFHDLLFAIKIQFPS